MEYLFSVSKQNGAEMALLYSDDVAKALIRYIKENKVANLLTGIPNEGDSVTTKIWKRFTHINFFVVEQDGSFGTSFLGGLQCILTPLYEFGAIFLGPKEGVEAFELSVEVGLRNE